MSNNKIKKIGDTTSITFPETFKHFYNHEKVEVTKEMMQLINDSFKKRAFTNLIMTMLWEQLHGQESEEESLLIDIRKKLDTIHNDIKGRTFSADPIAVVGEGDADTLEDDLNDLDELVNQFKA